MKFAGSAAMKAMDTYAIESCGIPSDTLMLRAAFGAAEEAEKLLVGKTGNILIFCGSGNNGGDGIAVAMYLVRKHYHVRCFMVGSRSRMTEDSCKMEELLKEAGGLLEDYKEESLSFEGCSLIVDALFGTGLSREITGHYESLIQRINASGCSILACDIPSGIHADSGRVLGCAVHAETTVTFNLPKTGQLLPPGTEYTGHLAVHDIGIPQEAKDTVRFDGEYVTAELVKSWLPTASLESHKGDYGKLLLLCGSRGFTGAAVMAARAALRTGAGLVYLGVPESVYPVIAAKVEEPVVFPLPATGEGTLSAAAASEIQRRLVDMDACLFGPGVGRNADTAELAQLLIRKAECPVLLDADGLNVFSSHVAALRQAVMPVVLTPHEGEFKRLGGDLSNGRLEAAKQLARETGTVVVLKGYRTVTASPEGSVYINSTGNPGMAVGGSGDVLSGIMACLLGQGMEPAKAAAAAVWLHGAAGDLCAEVYGRRSMLPTDMIEYLPRVLKALE